MFELKNVTQILSSMITYVTTTTSKITDFNPGSVSLSILESVGLEIESWYIKVSQAIKWAINEAIYTAFDYPKKAAVKASGYVTLTFNTPLSQEYVIPTGMTFCTKSIVGLSKSYACTVDTILPIGTTEYMLYVECTEYGEYGNTSANTITQLGMYDSTISSVTNVQPFLNGAEEESDVSRQDRFKQYIANLARATDNALIYGTLSVPGVAGARYDDTEHGIVYIYAYDANGNLPDDLKVAIEANLENYRAGGVQVIVSSVSKKLIDISADVLLTHDSDEAVYQQLVQDVILDYLSTYKFGEELYLSSLIYVVKNIDKHVLDVKIKTPTADVTATSLEIIRSQNLTIQITKSDVMSYEFS